MGNRRLGCVWILFHALLLTLHDEVFAKFSSSKELILRSKKDCNSNRSIYTVGKDVSEYRVVMQWSSYNCSKHERGFSCSQTFIQESNFDNLGTRLCVDLQGVQNDIQEMNQLLVTVSDKDRDLKKVYSITRLRPEYAPYYVCTQPTQSAITIAITVRPSVTMCPDILNYFFSHRIKLGTVTSRPVHSIVRVDLDRCSSDDIPRNESYLVKVNMNGANTDCGLNKRLPLPYSHMRGCLKVVYFSQDFDCDVEVLLYSEHGLKRMIELPLDRTPGADIQRCESFAGRDGLPLLSIKTYPYLYKTCSGQFAFSIDFRQTPPPDQDDDEDEARRSPNLYMAVFITLIAICLVCLGLTCLCCIRFRAKRLRRLQRRSSHRHASALNQGFHLDLDGAPPYDNISWSPTEPRMLHGLPSYDDVVGHSSGINPSDDSYKNELPPAYDSVCSTSET